tara:strand:- start:1008 stop:1277 length:270 start_codon:yes stop_codon:yes gene_type:complete
MSKHEAIYNLYSNVNHVKEKDDGTFTAYDKDEKEVTIDMDAVNTKAAELQTEYDNEETTKKNNRVSAYRKLSLTDDEILAIDPTLKDNL